MGNKIFERDYAKSSEDLEDILLFGELARKNSLFNNADEQKKTEFSRTALRVTFLAENLRALLEAYTTERSVIFEISAQKIELSQESLSSLAEISKVSNLIVEASGEKIRLKLEISLA